LEVSPAAPQYELLLAAALAEGAAWLEAKASSSSVPRIGSRPAPCSGSTCFLPTALACRLRGRGRGRVRVRVRVWVRLKVGVRVRFGARVRVRVRVRVRLRLRLGLGLGLGLG
jgi:hypothetical protein